MLTDYLVKCPHDGCGWTGNLLAGRDADAWRGAQSNVWIATFHCPSCNQEWQARIIGDDVEALPIEEMAPMAWPPQDLGGSD